MKLKTVYSPIKLGLASLSKKLRVAASAKKLSIIYSPIKLAIALGRYISFIAKTDLARAVDSIVKSLRKTNNEVVTVDDSVVIIPNKRVNEIVGLYDDQLYFAEDYVVGAPNFQTYTLRSQVHKTVYKPKNETLTLTDTKQFAITKSFAEQIGVTDDINGVLANDDQIIEFFKPMQDQILVSDADVKRYAGKYLPDTISVTSSGSLSTQSYTVDMTYFAEDYVGESRTFS